jgi:hypothetical protein
MTDAIEITTQEQWVLHRLERFYAEGDRTKVLKDVLDGKSNISLRILDWFVTNFSKKNNVSYVTEGGKHVIVYLAYKSHLKAYSKKMFDPFCRWSRIDFGGISTTVGQLNFFAWVMDDGILDYIEEHREEIHADMETRMGAGGKEIKVAAAGAGTRKKRHELSHSATKSLKRHEVTMKVSFD